MIRIPRALRAAFVPIALLAATAGGALIAQEHQGLGYQDTPMLPGGKWHVHDGLRPQPKAIDPGTASTPDTPGRPPSDAVVLFDGKDTSKWVSDGGGPAKWDVVDGAMVPHAKSGSIHTAQEFGDCQVHVEWASPNPPKGSGQDRGNSGVFLFGRYELQVLDNYQAPSYADGTAGAIYGQYPPLVNPIRKPGEWNVYDVVFNGPKFEEGKLVRPAYETVIFNGVLVQNHAELLGPVQHRALAHYTPHGPKGPLGLQDHGHPVRFRNIWLRELKDYDEQ